MAVSLGRILSALFIVPNAGGNSVRNDSAEAQILRNRKGLLIHVNSTPFVDSVLSDKWGAVLFYYVPASIAKRIIRIEPGWN